MAFHIKSETTNHLQSHSLILMEHQTNTVMLQKTHYENLIIDQIFVYQCEQLWKSLVDFNPYGTPN